MNEHEQNALWEKSLRGQLTPGEAAQLKAHLATRPDLRAQWEEEMALHELVRQLPDAPVSSNFTSLVMQAVAREEQIAARAEAPAAEGFMVWLRRHFAQITASTAVIAVTAFLVMQQQQSVTSRETVVADSRQEMAEQIKAMATVAPVPSVDALKDFEAINRMSQIQSSPEADMELLAALTTN